MPSNFPSVGRFLEVGDGRLGVLERVPLIRLWNVLYLSFKKNSSCGLTIKKIEFPLNMYGRAGSVTILLFSKWVAFSMFSSLKNHMRFKIVKAILKFALYSFIHNFWSTIFYLSSSGKLHCCHLTPVSFSLNPLYFYRFLTAAEILTNLLMSAGVIWPF